LVGDTPFCAGGALVILLLVIEVGVHKLRGSARNLLWDAKGVAGGSVARRL
jgi:hypothetical protein